MAGDGPAPGSASVQNSLHPDRTEYAQTSLTTFHDFWKSAILTDVNVCVEDGVLPCHRLVLAKNPVFRAMFMTEMSECGKDEVRLSGVRLAELRKLVGYLYTGEVDIDGESVQDLLLVANMWQFSAVQTTCEMYLDRYLGTSNCIGVMLLAEAVCCQKLLDRARNMVTWEFSYAREDPTFLELGEKQVKEILDSEELVVKSEEDVLTAVLTWVAHDPQGRLHSFPEVLQCVRLTRLRLATLKKLAQHPLVLEANECLEMITNAQLCLQERKCEPQKKDRHSTTHEVAVLFVGGQSQEMQKAENYDVVCYDEEDNSWRKVTHMPKNLSQMSVTVEGDTLYLTGGTTDPHCPGQGAQTCAYSYSFLQDTWKELPDMHVARCCHVSAVEKGTLYVIGGQQSNEMTDNSVEMYTADTNTWTICRPCPTIPPTIQACVAQGNLYLLEPSYMGLFSTEVENEEDNTSTFSELSPLRFQCYSPNTNGWNTVEDAEVRVKALGVYGNRIHMVTRKHVRPVTYDPVKMTTEEYPDKKRLPYMYTTGLQGAGWFESWSDSHDYLYRHENWGLLQNESVTYLPFSVENPVTVTVDKLSFGWLCRDLDLVNTQDGNISTKEGKAAEIVQ